MSFRNTVVTILAFKVGALALYASVAQTNFFADVNLSIPDGDVNGVQDIRTVVSNISHITSVRVRLKISGNFNGDLYGYLRHTSGSTTHISVLLNRPGRTAINNFGYADSGLDVTFDDLAVTDIHTYRDVTNPPAGSPLYGTWQPDARFVDPAVVTTASPRSAFLNKFEGLSAGGEWTLFLADVDAGATNFLNSWGLEIAGKAKPSITWTNPAAITYGTALGTNQLNATADVAGTFAYDPPAGTILAAGSNHILSVTFFPADTNSYVEATATVTLTVTAGITLSGTVPYYPTNYPPIDPSTKTVGGTRIDLSGDTNLSVLTLGDGSFDFAGLAAGGTYGVTPSKTNDNPTANGVTSTDLVIIRQHIVGTTPLNTPYKLLAADVNGSGSVNSTDLVLIRRLIVGTSNTFPAGLWRQLPANYVFADTNNPWTAPTNLWHTNLTTDVVGEDFVAIKLGDVNNSWTMPVGPSSLAARTAEVRAAPTLETGVRFEAGNQVTRPGERVTVPIAVSGFRDVTSAQFTLAWDPSVLRYVGSTNYGLKGLSAGNFGVTKTQAGELAFAWDDPQAAGATLAEGRVIFAVAFEVTGKAGDVSGLAFSDSTTLREASVNAEVVAFHGQDGRISVLEPGPPRLSDAALLNGVFQLSVPTAINRRYVLEYTDGLPGTNWTALPAIQGDGTVKVLVDALATNRQRFYRVRVLP